MSDGNTPIGEKFLGRNDIFGIEFNDGFVFIRVTGWEQLQYEPYTGVDTISSQSDSGFSRLEDSGDDILYVEKGDKKVLHVGIGQSPSDIRRYTNYPEGENRLRTIPNLSVPRPSNGDNYGFVDGNDSPYESPTDAEELIIPPGVHLDFNFYNPDATESKQPIINIKMREYNVSVIDPRQNPNVAKRVLSPGSPMPTFPAGSIDNQKNFGDLSSDWGVRAMTETEIENLGGGR